MHPLTRISFASSWNTSSIDSNCVKLLFILLRANDILETKIIESKKILNESKNQLSNTRYLLKNLSKENGRFLFSFTFGMN